MDSESKADGDNGCYMVNRKSNALMDAAAKRHSGRDDSTAWM